MAGGVRTAHGVPPSAMGSDQRSSVGHSRGLEIERSTRRWWSPRSARLWLRWSTGDRCRVRQGTNAVLGTGPVSQSLAARAMCHAGERSQVVAEQGQVHWDELAPEAPSQTLPIHIWEGACQ